MKKGNRNFRMYLDDILVAMHRINEYIGESTFNEFEQDYKTVDAVIRNFEIIGEAQKSYLLNSKRNILMFLGQKCTC